MVVIVSRSVCTYYAFSSDRVKFVSMLEKLVHRVSYSFRRSLFLFFLSFFSLFFFFFFNSKNTHEVYNIEKRKARSFDNDLVYAIFETI